MQTRGSLRKESIIWNYFEKEQENIIKRLTTAIEGIPDDER